MKKAVSAIVGAFLLFIVTILLTVIYMVIVKDTMSIKTKSLSSLQGLKLYFVYDNETSNSILTPIKKYCIDHSLDCLFVEKDTSILNTNNAILILLGVNTDHEKLKYGMVERPVIFTDFITTQSVQMQIDGNAEIQNSVLVPDGNVKILLPEINDEKLYMDGILNSGGSITIHFKSGNTITIDGSAVKDSFTGQSKTYANNGRVKVVITNTASKKVVHVNDVKYTIDSNSADPIDYVEINDYLLDVFGLFTMDDVCAGMPRGCVAIDNQLSGSAFVDFTILYDFLDYDSPISNAKSTIYHFFVRDGNDIDNRHFNSLALFNKEIYDTTMKTRSEAVKLTNQLSASVIEYFNFADLVEKIKEDVKLPFEAHNQNIYNFKDIVLVSPHYDNIGYNFEERIGYCKYGSKVVWINGYLSDEGKIQLCGKTIGQRVTYNTMDVYLLPYTDDTETLFAWISEATSS